MATMRFERRMSDQDALMWAIEKDPLLRSTITSVTLLDGPIDHKRLAEQMERASREIPRLRQRVVSPPFGVSPPEFAIDPNFDLAYHLRFQRAPGDGTLRELLDLASPFAMAGFDRARPLWEFVVFDDVEGGRSALVQKLHHSLIDGVGAMKLSMAFLDITPEGTDRGPMPDVPTAEVPGLGSLLGGGLTHEGRRALGAARRVPGGLLATALDPVGTARRTAQLASSAARMMRPVSEPMSPIMGRRSLSVRFDTLTAPLADLKAAAKSVDGRLNDAFVAGVAGGLRRYHERHGAEVDQLRMTMPINIRGDGDEVVAGNRFVPARFPFPISIADPAERMRALHDIVDGQRHEPALSIVDPISGILNRLPLGLATNVLGSMLKAIDVVTSNVPGAPFPIYLAGARVEANYGFGPLTGAATNVTLLSYVDEVHLAISTDPAAVPDPDVYVACLEEGLDEVMALAR
jgi:diacylglycerol O-acyltransferase / wax synthase